MKVEHLLEQERVEHNEIYAQQQDWLIQEALSWDRYYQQVSVPPHEGGSLYGFDHKIFLDSLLQILQKCDGQDVHILDYGCGTGALGIALATRGYKVSGFDLSDIGIKIAKEAAEKAGVTDRVNFSVANAQQLPYQDHSFDLVVGKAVLHHTIKYDGTHQELYRILKDGGTALFLEGGASNPLIALARTFTIQEELGDVPLTIPKVNNFAKEFKKVDIQGYFFLYMLKRFGYHSSDETKKDKGRNRIGKTWLFRTLLKIFLVFDQLFINKKISKLAGRYLIQLNK